MCLTKLREAVIAVVDNDDDPYKEPKKFQLEQWCTALFDSFYNHIYRSEKEKSGELFYLKVLSDEECWSKSYTPHGIKLNRREVARKIAASKSIKGLENDLTLLVRYQFACVYCLEEEIHQLLEEVQQKYTDLRDSDGGVVVELLKMAGEQGHIHDMTEFWSYYAIGEIGELNLKGKNFYAYGLEKVLRKWNARVEAVEYFWDKIKSDNSLDNCEKDKIFRNATISALGSGIQCDVFEFCFSQLNPNKYREFLRRDFEMNKHHESFQRLQVAFRFDLCRKVFDCLKPDDITENRYCFWLSFMRLEQCPDYYLGEAVDLVVHMWMKVGFDRHRAFALRVELSEDSARQGDLLLPLVKRNHMQAVWTILGGIRDEVSRELFKEFLNSKRGNIIVNMLEDDQGSLTTFLSHKYERKRRSSRLECSYKTEASGNKKHQTT